MYIAQKYV